MDYAQKELSKIQQQVFGHFYAQLGKEYDCTLEDEAYENEYPCLLNVLDDLHATIRQEFDSQLISKAKTQSNILASLRDCAANYKCIQDSQNVYKQYKKMCLFLLVLFIVLLVVLFVLQSYYEKGIMKYSGLLRKELQAIKEE